MTREKTDRLKLAEEIVAVICEENVYAFNSGLARNVVDGLWKLPVGVIQQLHALVVWGSNHAAQPQPASEQPEQPEQAPPEVCPLCLERTGGVAEPPVGQRFALELTRDLRVGGMTWEENSDSIDPGLCDVLRSDFAPHHLIAYYGDSPPPRACSPICQLPADAIEVWTIDESDGAEEE
jgi:hypothetical protein